MQPTGCRVDSTHAIYPQSAPLTPNEKSCSVSLVQFGLGRSMPAYWAQSVLFGLIRSSRFGAIPSSRPNAFRTGCILFNYVQIIPRLHFTVSKLQTLSPTPLTLNRSGSQTDSLGSGLAQVPPVVGSDRGASALLPGHAREGALDWAWRRLTCTGQRAEHDVLADGKAAEVPGLLHRFRFR